MEIAQLKLNPQNPRVIKDNKFKKLVQSIEEFPEMMEKRPMVCVTDEDGKIYPLGGNMRLKAIIELGYKQIPDNWVIIADDWTDKQRKEFIIKDNVSFGEWDFEELTNKWNSDELEKWGIPNFSIGVNENDMNDKDINLDEEFDTIGNSIDKQRVVFIFENSNNAEKYLKSININNYSKKGSAWQVNIDSQFI